MLNRSYSIIGFIYFLFTILSRVFDKCRELLACIDSDFSAIESIDLSHHDNKSIHYLNMFGHKKRVHVKKFVIR